MTNNPVTEPLFTQLLVLELREQRLADGPKAKAYDTPFRHSDAGKCARLLGLKLSGIPESNPFDLPSDWVTSLGTLLHERWQKALLNAYPDAEIEPKVQTYLTSGHIDALVTLNGKKFSYELKTINGFGFAQAVGVKKMKGGQLVHPAGPRYSHIIQASLNAHAAGADFAVIGYLALESISMQVAKNLGLGELDRIMAEWIIPREEFEPIALAELDRLDMVYQTVKNLGVVPEAYAVGDNGAPLKLSPRGPRPPWQCVYCSHHDACYALPLEVSVAE